MKKGTYQINIEQPCHEEWNNMSIVEQGRFCDSCRKCVIDFTQFSDKEILQFLAKNKGEVCGRFANDQLDRPLLNPNNNRKPHYSFLLVGLFLIGIADFSFAKPPLKPKKEFSIQSNNDSLVEDKEEEYYDPKDSTHTIEGTITNRLNKKTIEGVAISIKGTNVLVQSDKNGHYEIMIPLKMLSKKITLIFDNIGYDRQELVLDVQKIHNKKNIQMTERPMRPVTAGMIAVKPVSK